MKKTMILIAFIGAIVVSQAQHHGVSSKLVLSTFDHQPFTIQIDGFSYQGQGSVVIDNLGAGTHHMKVINRRTNGQNGGFVRTLFTGTIDIPARSKVKAKISRKRRLHIENVRPLYAYGNQYGGQNPYGTQNCGSQQVQHNHYGSHVCKPGCPAFTGPSGYGQVQHDHYGSQTCVQGCPAYVDNCTAPTANHNHYGVQECTHACPAYAQTCHPQGNAQQGGYGQTGGWGNSNYGNQGGNYYGQVGMETWRFEQLVQNIEGASFESNKFSIAKQSLRNESISTDQVKRLMNLFTFESTKLELAKVAYDSVVDKGNFLNVTSEFTFASSTEDLIDYINA